MGYRLNITVPAHPGDTMEKREAEAMETLRARARAAGIEVYDGEIVERETFTQDGEDVVSLTFDFGGGMK